MDTPLCITGSIGLFYLDATSGVLTPNGRIEIGSGVDNIVDPDGRLWVAAHPKLLTFVRHVSDPTALAPSQVFRIGPATRRVPRSFWTPARASRPRVRSPVPRLPVDALKCILTRPPRSR
jgi:hypothetical protein